MTPNLDDSRQFELHAEHRQPTVDIAELEYVEQNGQAVIHHPTNTSAYLGGNTHAFFALENLR